ncbi:MAG: hypothetical protein ACLFP2_04635 [Candidatus Woesearchaeota archaeon]
MSEEQEELSKKDQFFVDYGKKVLGLSEPKPDDAKDKFEFAKDQLVTFDFPKTDQRYYLVYESFKASIEESYFWIMNTLQYDMGMAEIEKITDSYGAGEHSTFFNVGAQRIGMNQERVFQYLGSIGKLIKDLFAIVRELRIIDQREEIYYRSKKIKGFKYDKQEWEKERNPSTEDANEISLKGLFVNMAEGGGKNPDSVFGLAQQLQYTALPDLFFTIQPRNDKEVSEFIDQLQYSKNLKWVLKRKLIDYLRWKKHTYKELINRRHYQIKYLRQHYNVIKAYIAWIRPYLKTIYKMRTSQEKQESADLVSFFETSLLEIEMLGKFLPKGNKEVYSCVSVHFTHRTKPEMNFTGEGYQRAPLHVGEIKLQCRGYAWTNEEIAEYKKMREQEDLDMIASVEESLQSALDALGEDLEKYLIEGGEWKKEEKESEKPPKQSLFEPFEALFSFASPLKDLLDTKPKEPDLKKERATAKNNYGWRVWNIYKLYKKSHSMITW